MKKLRRPKPERRPDEPSDLDAAWRLFIAVPVPEPVRDMVRDLVAALEPAGWPVRWIEPGNAHITLQFIGEVSPEQAELLRLALPDVVAQHRRFRLRTADLGVFPTWKRPRVLWLGTHGPNHRLEAIHRDVTTLLAELDLPADDKPFHPHITLGRVRDTWSAPTRGLPDAIRERYDQIMAGGKGTAATPESIPIDEIVLMRSRIGPGGSQYEPVTECPLGRPEPRSLEDQR